MNSRRPRRASAFTRVDLAAVLATISLLAVVLLTTGSTTSVEARAAGCLSNMRRLTQAWLLYAADNREYFPPNADDGGTGNWVSGDAFGARDDSNLPNGQLLVDPHSSLLGPYSRDPVIYRCPADLTSMSLNGKTFPHVRSYAANQAVGTKRDGYSSVDGSWLDGVYSHTANRTWYTYGKTSDIVHPSPSRLWLLIDEDGSSINDGGFAIAMILPTQMIDWPGTGHNLGATVSYADGGAEIHRWKDSRTPVRNGNVARVNMPGNEDLLWLQNRTTTLVGGNRP